MLLIVQLSHVPDLIPGRNNTCILLFVDANFQVAEMHDGTANMDMGSVSMADVSR